MGKGKRHVVLWSGGLDSTYMILDILTHENRYNFDHYEDELAIISIAHINTSAKKLIGEDRAKHIILPMIKEKFPAHKISFNEISVYVNTELRGDGGLSHPIFWFMNVYPMLRKGDILYFSYVHGDEAPQYMSYLEELNAVCSRIQGYFGEDKVKLCIPLSFIDKEQIIVNFYDRFPEIIKHIHFCEFHHGKPCSFCHCCQDMKAALFGLIASDSTHNKNIGNELLEYFFGLKLDVKASGARYREDLPLEKYEPDIYSEAFKETLTQAQKYDAIQSILKNHTLEELEDVQKYLEKKIQTKVNPNHENRFKRKD